MAENDGGPAMREYMSLRESTRSYGMRPDRETIPCGICGTSTPMLGTRRCDRCYELETRIRDQPELARQILTTYEAALGPLSDDAMFLNITADEFDETAGFKTAHGNRLRRIADTLARKEPA